MSADLAQEMRRFLKLNDCIVALNNASRGKLTMEASDKALTDATLLLAGEDRRELLTFLLRALQQELEDCRDEVVTFLKKKKPSHD